MRNGKVFVDANILIHAATFKSADVFNWIDSLYEDIYIHQVFCWGRQLFVAMTMI